MSWIPRSTALRIGGAAVAMIVVAEAAVWLLRPRGEVPAPLPVSEQEYFSAAELDRAHGYSGGQRRLFLIGLAVEGGVLVAIALRPPRRLGRRLGFFSRPLLGAAAAGAAFSITLAVVAIPTGLAAHDRAVDAGLSTQSTASWFWDVARSAGIGAALLAVGAAILLALVRRFGARWWVGGAVGATLVAIVLTWLAPVILAPIFNKFEPLPQDSRTRAEVLELASRAGVEVGEVYSIDASRRTRTLNAYVDGIGSSRRVVLYDNLLRRADRDELESVVAHELGHVAHDDIVRGLGFVAIVAPFGMLFAAQLAGAINRRNRIDPRSPAAVPAYLVAIAAAAFVLNVPGNQLSRKVEASADAFALELTKDPNALIELQTHLLRARLGDPDPPVLLRVLFGTHPPAVDRIGAALAYRAELSEPETSPR